MKSSYYLSLMERNWAAMPDFMQDLHYKMHTTPRPSIHLSKSMFVKEWFFFFDKTAAKDSFSTQYCRLSSFSKKTIDFSCNWTADKFALLDLGGNYKWIAAIVRVASLVDQKEWNDETEEALVLSSFISDTRWAEDISFTL